MCHQRGNEPPGPNQLTISNGTPEINVNLLDVGLYVQDDWRGRQNFTLSLGLRWESQTGISDHSDFAPRLGVAWGVNGHKNKAATTVIRAGFGIFYDCLSEGLLLSSERYNGTTRCSTSSRRPPVSRLPVSAA